MYMVVAVTFSEIFAKLKAQPKLQPQIWLHLRIKIQSSIAFLGFLIFSEA